MIHRISDTIQPSRLKNSKFKFTMILSSGFANSLTHFTFLQLILNFLLPLGEGPGMRERIITLYLNFSVTTQRRSS